MIDELGYKGMNNCVCDIVDSCPAKVKRTKGMGGERREKRKGKSGAGMNEMERSLAGDGRKGRRGAGRLS